MAASLVPEVVKALPRATSELGKVKITDVKTAQIQANYAYNLVKLETDSGLVGLGEAFAMQGIVPHIEWLKQLIVGQDPLLVETHWNRIASTFPSGLTLSSGILHDST